jgi:hypothetical protein
LRRALCNDLVNALADMFVHWLTPSDLEVIAGLPDGKIDVDVLARQATHTAVGPIDLGVSRTLRTWLDSRLADHGLLVSSLSAAGVSAEYRSDRIPTNRDKIVSFDWNCQGHIAVQNLQFIGRMVENHKWHTREAT